MRPTPALLEAFRRLQAADAAAALAASRQAIAEQGDNARAHLAAGLALRMLGRLDESWSALEHAARLDPADYGVAYENGVALMLMGRGRDSVPWFDRALQLRPELAAGGAEVLVNLGLALAEAGEMDRAEETLRRAEHDFPGAPAATHALGWMLHKAKRTAEALPHLEAAVRAHADPRWRVDLGKALADRGRHAEARAQFEAALAATPRDRVALVTFGRFCVGRGDFAAAADLFRAAAAAEPRDVELPMYLAQVELARGRWREGWLAYARREPRLRFEAERARGGLPYVVPAKADVQGELVLIVGEQGLGDELFFLRFAPALRASGARLAYRGDERLGPLLARTGLFEQLPGQQSPAPMQARTVLCGDLPLLLQSEDTPPSLAIAPDPARLEAMRRRLERAGPRPWIGVTWRAGTPREVVAYALHKSAPLAGLFAAMPREGTVLSLQRDGHFDELESASHALGRPIYDFSQTLTDLEDSLALVALLDRHIGVSNTNMHLAAAAGAVADVLVPFPPEWRWCIEGDSPWFPGFRVYRQSPDGDWSRAYAALASAAAGSTSRE